MVKREIIEDVISKSIVQLVKCPSSSRAKKLGATGIVSENSNGGRTITYSDGTMVSLDRDDVLENVSREDTVYNYLGRDKVYKHFQYQDELFKKTEAMVKEFHNYNLRGGVMQQYNWETEYDFVKYMCDRFASSFGMDLNRKVFYGDDKLLHYTGENHIDSPFLPMDSKEHIGHFFELARNNPIDNEDISLVTYTRGFHQEDDLSKLSFTRKGYTSTSAGGDDDELMKYFKGDNGWTVVTTVGKGSGAKGLFFGNALTEARTRMHDFVDWEAEVNLPPRTRFTRDIIDEENHIIVQHIERQ